MRGKSDNRRRRYVAAFAVMIVLAAVLLIMNICIGSVNVPLKDILNIISGRAYDETTWDIIMSSRFPRTIAAAVLGGALALSGYLLQTFFHNPIAGPFTLGISSGSKLVVSITMVVLAGSVSYVSSFMLIGSAFIGAMISMGFVLLISKSLNQMSMLVVGGVMIGYICTAITDFIVTFAEDSDIVNLHNWSRGSFSGMTWANIWVILPVTAVAVILVFLISKPISAYQMGETYAQNMGLNIKLFRVELVLLSSILSAVVTAFAGPISFVGTAVPHIVKGMLKTTKPILMIPGCFLTGASFCLMCDLIARIIFAPVEMSISTVTAVFGAPIVIYTMIRSKKQKEGR